MMPEAASLPFDIVTITSLILLVERKNEIQTFPESTVARYSEKTLIDLFVQSISDVQSGFFDKFHCRNFSCVFILDTHGKNRTI